MNPRKQDKSFVWHTNYSGTKEMEKLSYLDNALEALVSEANFSIDKVVLGVRPAEFLDGKYKKGLGKEKVC